MSVKDTSNSDISKWILSISFEVRFLFLFHFKIIYNWYMNINCYSFISDLRITSKHVIYEVLNIIRRFINLYSNNACYPKYTLYWNVYVLICHIKHIIKRHYNSISFYTELKWFFYLSVQFYSQLLERQA